MSFTPARDRLFSLDFLPSFKSHIECELYGDPFDGSYPITGPQMVLVMKLTTFAWNVWDGRRPVKVCLFSLRPKIDRVQTAYCTQHAY